MENKRRSMIKSMLRAATGAFLVFMFTVVLMTECFAATGKISFSDPEAKTGSEVNVTMKITADSDAKLSNANVILSYDSEKLEFVAGTDSDGGAGTVRVHGASNGAGTSTLEYNLKFNAKAAGTAAVNISTQEVYDDADQPVEMSHLGSSSVNISAKENVSANADLASLAVSPGTLSSDFDAASTDYSVTVGASVDKLIIDAVPADSGANVIVSGNEGLQMGENTVVIKVTAADGTTSKDYTLNITKEEGGPEAPAGSENTGETGSEPESEGVKLSSTGKTITIMTPGSDVKIPEGFKEGTIAIDGHKVRGWVWGADADPQYCVVYGMNESGELNFYRYDIAEKTIQRYFEDPLAAGSVSNKEYTELSETYDSLVRDYDMRFLLICVLALTTLIFLVTTIYLAIRSKNTGDGDNSYSSRYKGKGGALKKAVDKEPVSRRNASAGGNSAGFAYDYDDEYGDEYAEEYSDEADLSHDYSYKDEPEAYYDEAVPDETQVIRHEELEERAARKAEATSDKKDEKKPAGQTSGSMTANMAKSEEKKQDSDIFDDEFDTFDI